MFSLSKEQLQKVNEWIDAKPRVYCGAIGGRFTYHFTPTSLGLIIKVTDELNKDEIDVSEYSEW